LFDIHLGNKKNEKEDIEFLHYLCTDYPEYEHIYYEFCSDGLYLNINNELKNFIRDRKFHKELWGRPELYEKLHCAFCKRKIKEPPSLCNCEKDPEALSEDCFEFFIPNNNPFEVANEHSLSYVSTMSFRMENLKLKKQRGRRIQTWKPVWKKTGGYDGIHV
jgi:hypothetical protein